MSEQKSLSQAELRQFTGTERWYRHGINHNVLYTDGAKYVADTAGAYWLLDAIAIIQPHNKRVAAEATPNGWMFRSASGARAELARQAVSRGIVKSISHGSVGRFLTKERTSSRIAAAIG